MELESRHATVSISEAMRRVITYSNAKTATDKEDNKTSHNSAECPWYGATRVS